MCLNIIWVVPSLYKACMSEPSPPIHSYKSQSKDGVVGDGKLLAKRQFSLWWCFSFWLKPGTWLNNQLLNFKSCNTSDNGLWVPVLEFFHCARWVWWILRYLFHPQRQESMVSHYHQFCYLVCIVYSLPYLTYHPNHHHLFWLDGHGGLFPVLLHFYKKKDYTKIVKTPTQPQLNST